MGLDSQLSLTATPQRSANEDTALLEKFKILLQHELAATVTAITTDIAKQIHKLGQRTDVLENKVDDITTVLDAHEHDITDLQTQLQEAKIK